jgi:hypothetical protein
MLQRVGTMEKHALDGEVAGTLARLQAKHGDLPEQLQKAYGYAVFPSVGRGATYGRGEVFEHGRLIGNAAIIQLTLGVQLGGETFIELVTFDSPESLTQFKRSKVAFEANAAAVIVKAGAATTTDTPPGASVQLASEGGLLLEAALGAQKFVFRSAALTRGKKLGTDVLAS